MSKKLNNSCSILWSRFRQWSMATSLGLAFHHQDPTFINAYCQAATNEVDQDWGQWSAWAKGVCAFIVLHLVYLFFGESLSYFPLFLRYIKHCAKKLLHDMTLYFKILLPSWQRRLIFWQYWFVCLTFGLSFCLLTALPTHVWTDCD